MSTFYGSLQGCRGAATRCGSKSSGIRTSAQSWDGSIICNLDYDSDGKLIVKVGTNNGSSCCTDWNSKDFWGSFEEFKNMLKLYQEIKEGKVKVIRHRKKKIN